MEKYERSTKCKPTIHTTQIHLGDCIELRERERVDYLGMSFLEILGFSFNDFTVNDVLLKIAVHGHLPSSYASVKVEKL